MTNLSRSYLVFVFFASIFLHSCDDDQPVPKSCCDHPAINEAVGIGHVYVPNIFTPDGDGRNDYLNVFGDYNIGVIRKMVITNNNNEVVFLSLDLIPNNPTHGWDGRVNGKVEKGLYFISIQVEAIDGTIGNLNGVVCNFPCDDDAEKNNPLKITNCQFPSQNDNGQYGPTLPPGEAATCFEY